MKLLGQKLTDEQVEEMMEEAGMDEQGGVSFDAFTRITRPQF